MTTHGFARETDLAECRCGDWHPIAYLAHLPAVESELAEQVADEENHNPSFDGTEPVA